MAKIQKSSKLEDTSEVTNKPVKEKKCIENQHNRQYILPQCILENL